MGNHQDRRGDGMTAQWTSNSASESAAWRQDVPVTDLGGQMRLVYERLSPLLSTQFEHFEFNLLRGPESENTVGQWLPVVLNHLEFIAEYPDACVQAGRDVYCCLCQVLASHDWIDDVPPALWDAVYRFCTERPSTLGR